MMRIYGDLPPEQWITPHVPRVIFDLAARNHWANLTHLTIEGAFGTSNCVEEMLVALLRSGSMRNLQHLSAMLERALSCHSLTYWDTPKLKTVQYRTGPQYWEFFPKNNFDAMFRVPCSLTNFTFHWAPFTVYTDASRQTLGRWPNAANHFLDQCRLHNSVQSLVLDVSPYPQLLAVQRDRWPLRPSTLVNPWPKVTHLRVRPFVFKNNEYKWVLQKFPSLLELVVEYGTLKHQKPIGELVKNLLLETLGQQWRGSVRVRGPRELVASVTLWKQKKKSC
jgi:hypothetical protein